MRFQDDDVILQTADEVINAVFAPALCGNPGKIGTRDAQYFANVNHGKLNSCALPRRISTETAELATLWEQLSEGYDVTGAPFNFLCEGGAAAVIANAENAAGKVPFSPAATQLLRALFAIFDAPSVVGPVYKTCESPGWVFFNYGVQTLQVSVQDNYFIYEALCKLQRAVAQKQRGAHIAKLIATYVK